MTIETEVAALTTATTNLLTAVNTSKATLDAKVDAAGVKADAAAASATSANSANASAQSLLGGVGNISLALAIMLGYANNATGAVSQARAYAAQAASVVQQDLSGVSAAALHRSPNAVTAMAIYDTSKDSDGGAWVERMHDRSWMNEALNGAWLGAHASEFDARVVGGTLAANLVTNGTFDTDTSGWTANNSNLSVVSGELQVAAIGASYGQAVQSLPLVSGKTYVVSVDATIGTAFGGWLLLGSSGPGAQEYGLVNVVSKNRTTLSTVFTATGNTLYVCLQTNNTVSGGTLLFDNISVREVTAINTKSGDYYQLTTDGKFYKLEGTYTLGGALPGVTETFRGNKAEFPRLSAIVAETPNVTIYDLTEPGRPMWMRFAVTFGTSMLVKFSDHPIGSLAALNGKLVVGSRHASVAGWGSAVVVDFPADSATGYTGAPAQGNMGVCKDPIAKRIGPGGYPTVADAKYTIVNGSVNAIAMTVLPNAPFDPVTGLQVPTIAVGTGLETSGGVSVLCHDGTVANITAIQADFRPVNKVGFDKRNRLWLVYSYRQLADDAFWHVVDIPTNSVAASHSSAITALNGEFYRAAVHALTPVNQAGQMVGSVISGDAWSHNRGLTLFKRNPSNQAAGLVAYIHGAYNTGWMPGDIRRAWLAEASAGTINGANVITNGTFDTNTAGWVPDGGASIAATGGELVVTNNTNGATEQAQQTLTSVMLPGRTYAVSFTARRGTANTYFLLLESQNVSFGGVAGAETVNTTYTLLATVPTDATDVTVRCRTSGLGTCFFDNITVKEVAADRSNEAKSLSVVSGTLTRTLVATAAQMVAYSGFSNDSTYNTELVENGTFNADVSGWTTHVDGDGSFTWSAGTAVLTRGSSADQVVKCTSFTTVPGRKYLVSVTVSSPTPNYIVSVTDGESTGYISTAGTVTLPFTALGSSSQVFLSQGGSTGASTTFDNVSVKPLNAVGSSANVLQEDYSADLDFGTGAWNASAFLNVPETGFGPANFFLNSEDFSVTGASGWDNYWAGPTSRTANTSDVPDPKGGNKATKLVLPPSTPNPNGVVQGTSVPGGLQVTAGVWLRGAVGGELMALRSNDSVPATNITLTNQWAFYQITQTPSAGNAGLQIVSTNTSAAQTVYVYGAQLNRGASLSPYTATTNSAYNGIAPIIDRSAITGPYYRMGVDGNGAWAAEAYDGTTTRRVTGTAANTGVSTQASVAYTTDGKLTLNVAGKENAVATGAPLLTLNNSLAVATVGNSRTLDAAFPGSIALVKLSASVPSADAAAFMYEQERQMFRDGAQVTLPDTNAVLDISHDPVLNQLKAVSAINECSFSGLVRVASSVVPTPVGGFSKCFTHGGVQLLARATTVPGVDITMPSQNLRKELQRRAEDARAAAGMPVVFDFDATASQADFVLPIGYEAVEVMAAGASKREGVTKDWTRKFDGFRESVSFLAGQAASTWVQTIARKSA